MSYHNHTPLCAIIFCIGLCISACGTSKTAAQNADAGIQPGAAESVETPAVQNASDSEVLDGEAPSETGAATEPASQEAASESVQPSGAGSSENEGESKTSDVNEVDIPADFVRCEVTIEHENVEYNAQAAGPTIEEARDNAAEEACAIPCAAVIEKLQLSEDETETQLDECTEKCLGTVKTLGEICFQNGQNIYSAGVLSDASAGQQE